MARKDEGDSESRIQLVLGVPGLLLVVALFYPPVGHALGWFILLIFDWCLLQATMSLVVFGLALFQRRRRMVLWSLYSFLGVALPLVIVAASNSHRR